jgi:hypothetical protein
MVSRLSCYAKQKRNNLAKSGLWLTSPQCWDMPLWSPSL